MTIEEKVRKYLDVSGGIDLMLNTFDHQISSFKRMAPEMNSQFDAMRKVLNPSEMLDDLVPIFVKLIPEHVLDASIAFWETPEGKELRGIGFELQSECTNTAESWAKTAMEKAFDDGLFDDGLFDDDGGDTEQPNSKPN
jgi:hypothetical protein